MIAAWLLGALAAAREPVLAPISEDEPAEDTDADEAIVVDTRPPEVVLVEGDRVERARREVMDAAKEAGYAREIRKAGRTILRHDDPWKGELVMWDDGRIRMKRQPVRFEPPTGTRPVDYLWCLFPPACIRPGGQTVVPRIQQAREREALAAVGEEVGAWREALSNRAIDGKVDALPDRLTALWTRGIPLEPDQPLLATWPERRAAIFAHWDSRTETEWGERVRDAVEAFVRGVVQGGEHPYTPDEIASLNARRTVLREFLAPRGP